MSGQNLFNVTKKTQNILRCSISTAIALGLLVSIPTQLKAQAQLPLSAQQSAALAEAEELNQQAVKLYRQGKYGEAIPLAEKALAIREKILGKEHPLVAQGLNNLAALYQSQGNNAKAESLYLRSLAIQEKVLGTEHPKLANSLNNLAALYREQGNYAKAEPLYLRSLAIYEKVGVKEHPDLANSLNNLAELYREQGNYAKAEPLYLRSLAMYEKLLGKEHPNVAISLNNLALLYQSQGNYAKAEPLYLRSLAMYEKLLGKEHPNLATSLNNLAELYRLQGSYAKAEPLYLRSLAIFEKVLGKEHAYVALSLNNLALIYRLQGKYAKAEPLYLRSLTILEKVVGKEHPDVALSLNNLAEFYRLQGSYTKAEPLYLRSLAIREKTLGKEHPDVAQSLNNLAEFYRLQGNYTKAEPLYLRSLAIREKTLGKEHPNVATSLNNLAGFYWTQGDINRTTDFLTRGLAIEEQNLQLIYAVGSEQRKQNYAQQFSVTTDAVVALALQQSTKNPTLAKLALTTVLRRKGRVLDAMTDTVQTLRSQLANNPQTKKLFDDWLNVQQELAALVYRGQGQEKFAVYQAQIRQLEAEKERLEEQVSAKSAEFRQATQPVELAAIQAQIPPDAAMVEIVQYQPYNPKAKQDSEKWGKPRYAAVVLRAAGEPKWVDLGDAATIDQSVANFRQVLVYAPASSQESNNNSPERGGIIPEAVDGKTSVSRLQTAARALYEHVMAPIRPLLGDARHLLLSPDGQLNLIPFEALKDEQNQYLVQRYAFSYLTTGRDLLNLQTTAKAAANPVVLADIDYEQQDTTVAAVAAKSRSSSNQRSIDFANLTVSRLTATLAEGQQIQKIIPQTNILLGKQATEAAIKQLNAPRILHLATHGFFLPDKTVPTRNNNVNQQLETAPALNLENPLLRSGLALAGFNNRQQKNDTEDGVLTALEVAGLNLRGTELVVLSACETGLGDVKIGGGVYGLRRALVIAGSQSQLLSLWQVADDGTKDLMVKYYEKLQTGKGRHEALREVQLELLNNPQYQHPYYWASFIPAGNWRAMK
ncbi:CHAT domain-containing protein [Calothrix sp. FACHB-1219]|uniref:CHAT domain-containing tetratricopeptide repeat protein n=1 Tax=unclassified Calothrix TaxID=2619626 RepID=UPI001682739F|nr:MULTISPECIES: CHAT domain-containing tetratricopeptide repeat protein [unclassified Calothrix]MBD2202795.1 CHAT domain-containing protein [Calothrix sp. FACHB-168]MBD2218948.1 CHAT domain-containing protein [Calothrix sp. FACHB-1219]